MAALIEDYSSAIDTPREKKAREKLYQKAASISVDYAVLENADNVLAIKADIVWDDVGSWSALERYKDRDSDNNVLVGEAVTLDSYETTIYNDATGMVAALGISDLVVVRSGDITLVAHKAKLDKIKDLLAQIEENEKFRHYL